MTMKPLSRTQQELLDALRSGVVVHRADDQRPQFMRMDNQRGCSGEAKALIRHGLARVENYHLVLTDNADGVHQPVK